MQQHNYSSSRLALRGLENNLENDNFTSRRGMPCNLFFIPSEFQSSDFHFPRSLSFDPVADLIMLSVTALWKQNNASAFVRGIDNSERSGNLWTNWNRISHRSTHQLKLTRNEILQTTPHTFHPSEAPSSTFRSILSAPPPNLSSLMFNQHFASTQCLRFRQSEIFFKPYLGFRIIFGRSFLFPSSDRFFSDRAIQRFENKRDSRCPIPLKFAMRIPCFGALMEFMSFWATSGDFVWVYQTSRSYFILCIPRLENWSIA